MFDWIVKTKLKASFLALAAIWLNTSFPFTLQIFISSIIQKRSSSFVVQDFDFYSNEYLCKNIHNYTNFLFSPRKNNVA